MNGSQDTTRKEAGDLLLEQGKLTEQQLEQVRRRQRRLSLPQHRAIVDLNFASEEDTWRALAAANHLEYVDPVALDLKRETLEFVRAYYKIRELPVRRGLFELIRALGSSVTPK